MKKNFLNIFLSNGFICINILFIIIMLLIGTVSQKYINIASSQELYFNSYFIYYKFLILPGGKILMSIFFISLLLRLLSKNYRPKKFGLLIIHLSMLIIIFGSFMTTKMSEEGFIIIKENSEKFKFILNYDFNLIIHDDQTKKKTEFKVIDNSCYEINELFKIRLMEKFNNFDFFIKNKPGVKGNNQNIFRYFSVKKISLFLESEENKGAISFSIKNNNEEFDNFFLEQNKIFKIKILNSSYSIEIKNLKKKIPFIIKLLKFNQINYKGTNIPMSYESIVLIRDNVKQTKFVISMNKPLKYEKYIFYQNSFLKNKNKIKSVFTVSYNRINFFYYFSVILLIIGFISYFLNFDYLKDKK